MMKDSALYTFWAGFGWDAYDELSIPDDVPLPYITYESATDTFDNVLTLSGTLWYRSESWAEIEAKAQEISNALNPGFWKTPCDGGYLWITPGTPFARRMTEPTDKMIRRINIMIHAEFLTAK